MVFRALHDVRAREAALSFVERRRLVLGVVIPGTMLLPVYLSIVHRAQRTLLSDPIA
jgi:hypothetical protein